MVLPIPCTNNKSSYNFADEPTCIKQLNHLRESKDLLNSIHSVNEGVKFWHEIKKAIKLCGLPSTTLFELINSYLDSNFVIKLDCRHDFIVNELLFKIFKIEDLSTGETFLSTTRSSQANLITCLRILNILYSDIELKFIENNYELNFLKFSRRELKKQWQLFKVKCEIISYQYTKSIILNSIKRTLFLKYNYDQLNFVLHKFLSESTDASADIDELIDILFDEYELIRNSEDKLPKQPFKYFASLDDDIVENVLTNRYHLDSIGYDIELIDRNLVHTSDAESELDSTDCFEDLDSDCFYNSDTNYCVQGSDDDTDETDYDSPSSLKTPKTFFCDIEESTIEPKDVHLSSDIRYIARAENLREKKTSGKPTREEILRTKTQDSAVVTVPYCHTQSKTLSEKEHSFILIEDEVIPERSTTQLFEKQNHETCVKQRKKKVSFTDNDDTLPNSVSQVSDESIQDKYTHPEEFFISKLLDYRKEDPEYETYIEDMLSRLSRIGMEELYLREDLDVLKFSYFNVEFSPDHMDIVSEHKYNTVSLNCAYCYGDHDITQCPIAVKGDEICNHCGMTTHCLRSCPFSHSKKLIRMMRTKLYVEKYALLRADEDSMDSL